MDDDYIVIPSNPLKESEKADSAARDDGKSSAKTAKKLENSIAYLIALTVLCILARILGHISNIKDKGKGPVFEIHSATVTIYSLPGWFNARWNISLGVKNLRSRMDYSYDFIQVSIFHGDTHLSTTELQPFRQVAFDELLLNAYIRPFPVKIDAGVLESIEETKRLNNTISINVVIRTKISRVDDDEMKWITSLIASCENIELQFFSDGKNAQMIAPEPVRCGLTSKALEV